MNTKSLVALAASLALICACGPKETPRNTNVAPYGQFAEGMINSVKPCGWIADALQTQKEALKNNPDASGAAKIGLGYLTGDEDFVSAGVAEVETILNDATEENCPCVSFPLLQACFEMTLDEKIPASLEDHYLEIINGTAHSGLADGDEVLTSNGFQGLVWTYAHTGNEALLEYAVAGYDNEVASLKELCEPILLYAYTGDESYLNIAYGAERELDNEIRNGKVLEDAEVADYSYVLSQFLMTTGHAHWADNIEDAVFVAAIDSTFNDVYGILPGYVSRMWLQGSHVNEVVAAMYGPSEISYNLGNDVIVNISEETDYPFSDDVDFVFHMDKAARFPFTFRVPSWCTEVSVSVNGREYNLGSSREKWENVTLEELNTLEDAIDCPECESEYEYASGFYTIERRFKDGDVISITLKTA